MTKSLTGKDFKFLNCSKNQKEILETFEEEYFFTEEDSRYELQEQFKRCMKEDSYEIPTDWFNRFDKIIIKLSNIDRGKQV